ncbi:hypothetical protein CAL7716_052670 [Calothrix sp. PCC 7716]|nr:hypothetical protein CAL7716_052670 [Calothrix sp. PCC 7716]
MLKGFYLTLLIGPTIPAPAPQSVIDALNSVQVTTSAGQASGFQLSFALSKKSLINRVMLPAGYFDPKMRVIVVMTINGVPNVLLDGVITRQEIAPSSEPGTSTLTVTGEDLSLVMDLENRGACYPAMPAEARVALIVAKYAVYGMIPLVIPTMFPDVDIPTQRIPVQTSTDLNYIKQLADQNGYVFYIEPGPVPGMNTAYWGPEIRIGIPQPALNINMDAQTNVESLSFSFDGLSRRQLAVVIQEPNTKIGITIPLPDLNILSPPLALKQAPSLRVEPLRDVAKLNPIKATARALAESFKSSEAVSGSGQLDVLRYGRVLRARQLVGVRGAGLTYDGLYYVKSVTHNIKRGEYKQSFTLSRNGLISITPRVIP